MWGQPKNLKLDFIIGLKAEDFLLIINRDKDNMPSYYINFTSSFSLNGTYYENEVPDQDITKLNILIGKKIVSAEFIKKDKGDLKLIFDGGDELIINENDWPYESYTMQTPEGLVVV